jgi:hypothetical protein
MAAGFGGFLEIPFRLQSQPHYVHADLELRASTEALHQRGCFCEQVN